MPPALRRRTPQQHLPPPEDLDDTDSEIDIELITGRSMRRGEEEEEEEEEEDEAMGDELEVLEGEEELEDEDALASPHQANTPLPNLDPPPSYLREISTLASWTVSSSKPGCSIPQLRHPSTSLFWQSDGPQPHYLNIHFFKLVRIVGLRLYLDFEQDESYTPTRIIFLAGSGMNDLQEWGEMKLESPRGWVWADFSGVGDPDSDSEGDDDEEEQEQEQPQRTLDAPRLSIGGLPGDDASSDSENNAPRPPPPRLTQAPSDETMHMDPHTTHTPTTTTTTTPLPHLVAHTPHDLRHGLTPTLARPTPRLPFAALSPNTAPHPPRTTSSPRRPKMPVLRAHLVQVKILENHQNGKDTHLRGLQIFARNDDDAGSARAPVKTVMSGRSGAGAGGGGVRTLMGEDVGLQRSLVTASGRNRGVRGVERLELGGSRSAWDVEPSIR
ncbi:galactose-binding like protein [Cucurbitaria berberidis CBS 394.84]|uniref:Galactose-binding like protein n=1 Tax=Cucurbitaria berberidis CBS 394.84 TaxID=1168544 RepID=A0A9P4GEN8_9PLEO|nr:galactose-binding like protein [Cucurbitaria berberidis CBS 394.84]KAF1844232.1 galactose-binding like protein [Cucurbitaria berberidis CBS 394.84]